MYVQSTSENRTTKNRTMPKTELMLYPISDSKKSKTNEIVRISNGTISYVELAYTVSALKGVIIFFIKWSSLAFKLGRVFFRCCPKTERFYNRTSLICPKSELDQISDVGCMYRLGRLRTLKACITKLQF